LFVSVFGDVYLLVTSRLRKFLSSSLLYLSFDVPVMIMFKKILFVCVVLFVNRAYSFCNVKTIILTNIKYNLQIKTLRSTVKVD
jgi:hypothetical protein